MLNPELQRVNISRVDEMSGNLPVKNPNTRIYSHPFQRLYSCWGVEATGPDRTAVLSGSIGTKEHAEQQLQWWQAITDKLTFNLKHLTPGTTYWESSDWGRRIQLYPRAHGFEDKGEYLADKRTCTD